jgi:D-alanine transaminase
VSGVPPDHLVLEGIRYGLVAQLCMEAGIPFSLRRVARDEVFSADEVLLSNASKEVLAVTSIDGVPVGKGRPGPVYQALYAGYQHAKTR